MDYSSLIKKVKDNIAVVVCIDAQNQISSKGSGFVFFQKGVLVTCNHVVAQPDVTIKVKLKDDGEFINAKIAIRDEKHDIAILEYDPALAPNSEPFKQCEVSKISEGMPVIFSGYPLDLFNLTTHQGILSAILKDPTGVAVHMIDGTVNGGNSGCPLFNTEGELIGVVNARRRENSTMLGGVESMMSGALSLHGVDVVGIYKAIISNLQLGMGYAIPCAYIPNYKIENNLIPTSSSNIENTGEIKVKQIRMKKNKRKK